MRSRRVPVLRLGSRGPGGDARSLRLWTQAFASVRGASDLFRTCVGLALDLPETKIVAQRRTVVTFYVSHYKSVNSHRDPGGRGRETYNCRHFWPRLGSSRLKSVDRGGSWSQNAELSSLLDSSRLFASQTVTGIGGVVVAKPRTVVTFGLVLRFRVSKVKCQQSQGCGGSWSQDAELSSLLAVPLERGKERGERRKER